MGLDYINTVSQYGKEVGNRGFSGGGVRAGKMEGWLYLRDFNVDGARVHMHMNIQESYK